jgi:hypothetical protein
MDLVADGQSVRRLVNKIASPALTSIVFSPYRSSALPCVWLLTFLRSALTISGKSRKLSDRKLIERDHHVYFA